MQKKSNPLEKKKKVYNISGKWAGKWANSTRRKKSRTGQNSKTADTKWNLPPQPQNTHTPFFPS